MNDKNRIVRRNLTRRAWPESTYGAAYYLAEKWTRGEATLASEVAMGALALAYMKYGKRRLRDGMVTLEELTPLVQAAWHEIDSLSPDDDTVRVEDSRRLNTLDLQTQAPEDVEARIGRLNPGIQNIARQLHDGATLAEIAKGMKVTATALRVRLHRLRKTLQE